MRGEGEDERLRPGQCVGDGRYVLGEELGRGGLALVFAAHDRVRGCEVALKVLRVRYVGRPEREERLRRELEYARRVEHPAVIEVFEGGLLEGRRPFFAMERVYGRPLSQVISGGGRLSIERVLRLSRALAEALAALHDQGIVHRDVKPANVLVVDDDRIKLLDLGMAGDENGPAVPAGHTRRLTRVDDLLGTNEYMAPEQVRKAPPNRAMDVFSLGIVMYELLAGLTPYSGMKMREYVALQVEGDPHVRSVARLARLRGAPVELAELIDECRVREPERRPLGMSVVIERLDRIAGSGAMQRALVLAPAGALTKLRRREAPTVVRALAASPLVPRTLERALEPRGTRARRGLMLGVPVAAVAALWLASSSPASSPRAAETFVAKSEESLGPLEVAPIVVAQPEAEPPAAIEASAAESPKAPQRPELDEPTSTRPVPLPRRRPRAAAHCDRVRGDAKVAVRRRDWTTALRLAAEHGCWPVATERVQLEVHALAQLQRWDSCVAAGRGITDEVVAEWVLLCNSHAHPDSGGA